MIDDADKAIVQADRPYPHANKPITGAAVRTGDYGNRIELGLSWEIEGKLYRMAWPMTRKAAVKLYQSLLGTRVTGIANGEEYCAGTGTDQK